MWAVVTPRGKLLALYSNRTKAERIAFRKAQRKGRNYAAIPWNGIQQK